jgi:CRP/FNR family cyclic AMP-dependent transcriptional regulator
MALHFAADSPSTHWETERMSADIQRELLAKTPLGTELTEAQTEALSRVLTTRRLQDGEVLIQEGHTDNTLHVITAGRLEVTRQTGGGDWITLHVLKQNDIAGEMGFVDGKEHTATLRAIGSAEVYSLSREALESLVASEPMLVYRVMRAIVREVHAILLRMNQQYVEMNNYIAKQHGRY